MNNIEMFSNKNQEGLDYQLAVFLYTAYLDCRKNKRRTKSAVDFEIQEFQNIYKLYKVLVNRTYEISESETFCVDRPVIREVFAGAYVDRVIHHLVIRELEPIFERILIQNTFSCRKKKGVLYGVNRCSEHISQCIEHYGNGIIIKLDLKGFFMNINKPRLFNRLKELVEKYYEGPLEKEFLIYLIEKIVFDCPQNHCKRKQPIKKWKNLPSDKSLFSKDKYTGIPIGNLTSQWFANFYLDVLDKFITGVLGLEYYGRYVDDFYIIVPENYPLSPNEIIKKIKKLLDSEMITLHPKKIYIQPVLRGLSFIGAIIKPKRTYIGNRTKGNLWWIINELIQIDPKELNEEQIEHVICQINSYLGFMIHYKTYKIRKKLLLKLFIETNWNQYLRINNQSYSKIIKFSNRV